VVVTRLEVDKASVEEVVVVDEVVVVLDVEEVVGEEEEEKVEEGEEEAEATWLAVAAKVEVVHHRPSYNGVGWT
jgi:hypothetical protein